MIRIVRNEVGVLREIVRNEVAIPLELQYTKKFLTRDCTTLKRSLFYHLVLY